MTRPEQPADCRCGHTESEHRQNKPTQTVPTFCCANDTCPCMQYRTSKADVSAERPKKPKRVMRGETRMDQLTCGHRPWMDSAEEWMDWQDGQIRKLQGELATARAVIQQAVTSLDVIHADYIDMPGIGCDGECHALRALEAARVHGIVPGGGQQ